MPLAQVSHEALDAFFGRESGVQSEGGSIEGGILSDLRARDATDGQPCHSEPQENPQNQ